ncbi:hypothetical protein KI387_026397, partial [Taxus chinensis]
RAPGFSVTDSHYGYDNSFAILNRRELDHRSKILLSVFRCIRCQMEELGSNTDMAEIES